MTTFAADKLNEAGEIFRDLGFETQHPRIHQYTKEVGNYWYTVSVGLEDAEDGQLEANISVLQTPKPKSELVKVSSRQVTVINVTEAPAVIRSVVNELQSQLGALQ